MTNEQKQLLRKHADHFQAMASYVRECDDDELATLLEACNAAGATNCGWDTWQAARFLEREIWAFYRMKNATARDPVTLGEVRT